jgi:hypothetical protein
MVKWAALVTVGGSKLQTETCSLLDTTAGVNSSICPAAFVAMVGAICVLFERCVGGRSRTWAYFFTQKHFFVRRTRSLRQ